MPLFFFFFRLNCVLLRYFRIHTFHQDHPAAAACLPSKFCINKLFNLCLRYLLGRLWYPGVGGRKGVAPLCGLSEYVLSIKVWCSRSSQNKVWALAIRSLYELHLRHRRNYTLVKCKVCETAPKSLVWAPTCVPKFEYAPWLACSKSHVWFSMQVARNSKRTSHNLWVCWGPEQVYRCCFAGARPSQVLLPVSLLVGPDLVARFPSLRIRRSTVDLHRSLSLVGGHAVDLRQVYAGYSIPGKKRPLLAWTGCRCGTDIFLFFFSFF